MKIKSVFIATCVVVFIPFVAPWEGGLQEAGGKPTEGIRSIQADAGTTAAAAFLPEVHWQFAELDVRDGQNRPVKAPDALAQLEDLFRQNMFLLASYAPLHGIARIWDDVELYSRLFKEAFFNIAFAVKMSIAVALFRSQKAVVHNVNNLWISFSVAVLLASLASLFILQKTPASLRILRC